MRIIPEGYTTLECSNCSAPLCEIFVYTIPGKEPKTRFLVAHCAHCGDKSYKVQVDGLFAFGPTEFTSALPEPDERDNSQVIIKTEIIKQWT